MIGEANNMAIFSKRITVSTTKKGRNSSRMLVLAGCGSRSYLGTPSLSSSHWITWKKQDLYF